jgi:hypothetical protein
VSEARRWLRGQDGPGQPRRHDFGVVSDELSRVAVLGGAAGVGVDADRIDERARECSPIVLTERLLHLQDLPRGSCPLLVPSERSTG